MVGLLACPQLLTDDFATLEATDGGACARLPCATGAGGSSDAGASAAGAAGSAWASGGYPPAMGGASASGGSTAAGGAGGGSGEGGAASAGAGGSGGAGSGGSGAGGSDAAGAGGLGGLGGAGGSDSSADPPECWFIELEDTTHSASDNCLGINGWNDVTNGQGSNVAISHEDGRVCFAGSVDSGGWGTVFNLTLNDTQAWNAVAEGVGGFRFEAEGDRLPPQIKVVYTDQSSSDFCQRITPGPAVQVPFESAHPGENCSANSSVTDAVDLTYIRLAFLPTASDYTVDFCLGIRAMP